MNLYAACCLLLSCFYRIWKVRKDVFSIWFIIWLIYHDFLHCPSYSLTRVLFRSFSFRNCLLYAFNFVFFSFIIFYLFISLQFLIKLFLWFLWVQFFFVFFSLLLNDWFPTKTGWCLASLFVCCFHFTMCERILLLLLYVLYIVMFVFMYVCMYVSMHVYVSVCCVFVVCLLCVWVDSSSSPFSYGCFCCCCCCYCWLVFNFVEYSSYEQSSWLFRTQRATFRLNSGYDSRHSLAASTLAGDSSFGSASIDITDIKIVSTVWTGSQRSDAFS